MTSADSWWSVYMFGRLLTIVILAGFAMRDVQKDVTDLDARLTAIEKSCR